MSVIWKSIIKGLRWFWKEFWAMPTDEEAEELRTI